MSTRRGRVHVTAAADTELSVEGGVISRDDEGMLRIHRLPHADLIEVRCPSRTDVTVGTVSGRVDLEGPLGAVRVATVSGKVRVDDAGQVDVRTKSGSVDIGNCAGECRVMVTSANVHIGRAARATVAAVSGQVHADGVEGAEVKTVSGKVVLATSAAGRVSVRTVSGVVEVHVPNDVRPSTRLKSLSGRVQCECMPGSDGEISVKSVSGAIKVACR